MPATKGMLVQSSGWTDRPADHRSRPRTQSFWPTGLVRYSPLSSLTQGLARSCCTCSCTAMVGWDGCDEAGAAALSTVTVLSTLLAPPSSNRASAGKGPSMSYWTCEGERACGCECVSRTTGERTRPHFTGTSLQPLESQCIKRPDRPSQWSFLTSSLLLPHPPSFLRPSRFPPLSFTSPFAVPLPPTTLFCFSSGGRNRTSAGFGNFKDILFADTPAAA